MSLQQIDYKQLAGEVYALMKQDQDEEEEEKKEEEEEEEEKREEEDSKTKDQSITEYAEGFSPETYAQFLAECMKHFGASPEECQGAFASIHGSDAAGEVKQDPSALQFSPEQMGVDPTDPTITPPEDAEGLCVESKMAKGMEEAQARAECAAERKDKGPQTAPEDAKSVLVLESMNKRLDMAIDAVTKLVGRDAEPDSEWMNQCLAEGSSEEECRNMWLVYEEAERESSPAKAVESADSKAVDTLKKFLIEKSHGAFTPKFLADKDLCYLRALDSVLDVVYKKAKDAPSGRPKRFPKVDDSKVEKVEFKKLTVGRKNKDTGEWEEI